MSAPTALAFQRLLEALADVSEAITKTETTDEVFQLWREFAPLVTIGLKLQDRMAVKAERLQQE